MFSGVIKSGIIESESVVENWFTLLFTLFLYNCIISFSCQFTHLGSLTCTFLSTTGLEDNEIVPCVEFSLCCSCEHAVLQTNCMNRTTQYNQAFTHALSPSVSLSIMSTHLILSGDFVSRLWPCDWLSVALMPRGQWCSPNGYWITVVPGTVALSLMRGSLTWIITFIFYKWLPRWFSSVSAAKNDKRGLLLSLSGY